MSRVTAVGVLQVLFKTRLSQLAREFDVGLPANARPPTARHRPRLVTGHHLVSTDSPPLRVPLMSGVGFDPLGNARLPGRASTCGTMGRPNAATCKSLDARADPA